MANTINYVSPERLGYYDEKSKAWAKAQDQAVKDALQAEIDKANEAIEAEKTRAIGEELTLTQAAQAAHDAANKAQGEVDALETLVGTLPEGANAKDVIGYINEKTANIASDTALGELTERVANAEADIDNIKKDHLKEADKTALQNQITANSTAIETLNGGEATEGSVLKTVKDEINDFATKMTEDGTINTFKEIVNYIATHGGEAAEMAAAIDTLETLVGSKAVAEQIAEAITAANLDQYATDAELAEAIARIVVVEDKAHTHENEEVLKGVTAEKVAAWDAAEANATGHADELNTAMDTRVKALEGVDHDAYKTADATLKAELDESIGKKADATAVADMDTAYKAADAALDGRVTALEGVTYSEVTTDFIDGLFA